MDLGNNANKDSNSVQLLFNYQTTSKEYYRLLTFPMNCEMTYKNIFENDSLAATNNYAGDRIISFSAESQDERAEEAFAKLKIDNVLDYNNSLREIFISSSRGTTGMDKDLLYAATFITINRIDSERILSYTLRVRNDSSVSDFYNAYLINGTLNVTYRVDAAEEYEFSSNCLFINDELQANIIAELE